MTTTENWFGKIFGGSDKSDSPQVAATKAGVTTLSLEILGMPGERSTVAILNGPNCRRVWQRATGRRGRNCWMTLWSRGCSAKAAWGRCICCAAVPSARASRSNVPRALNTADRRNFLAELQTWIDLPEHANLVPCRFFRTVGDEVLIFAEYVEGGSLKEWIHSRRLYEGGTQEALARMLDVAIQFAWGLHCLHELGLVHQDVKPGNVLMGRDEKNVLEGVSPRVTDYGLARARAAAGETFSTSSDPSRSIVVSSGGGTPAYWSPEQAAGLPLTRKTDIWSWGVSVLEMFAGEMTWISGQGAAEVLEQHLRQDRHDEAIPAMPGRLSELLRQCFCEKPGERPTSLGEVADRLKAIYRESLGIVYSRTLNAIERAASHKDRRTRVDPQEWLRKALRAAVVIPQKRPG